VAIDIICIWPGSKYFRIFTSLQSHYWSGFICVCLSVHIH